MKPQTPIIPGHDLPVTNFAESQDEYQTLPAFRQDDGTVLTRWRLTWKERLTTEAGFSSVGGIGFEPATSRKKCAKHSSWPDR
jgi:hypothetical protein